MCLKHTDDTITVSYDSSTDEVKFECSTCKKSSVEASFSEERYLRTQSKAADLLPYLHVSHRNKKTIIELKNKLVSDVDIIKTKFDNFLLTTRESFEVEEISVERIKHRILSFEAFTEDSELKVRLVDSESEEEIMAAKSLEDIFKALYALSYISFFNYSIIELLIQNLGSAIDQQRLKEYLAALHEFCLRNVFEVPNSALSCHPQCTVRKVLTIEWTKQVITLEEVRMLRSKVAKVFDLQSSALQLSSVHDSCSCIELHFLISAAVADRIFPVSRSHCSALSEIGLRALSCKKLDYKDEESKNLEELSLHLHAHGLNDCDFWLPQLKEHGVQSKKEIVALKNNFSVLSELKAKVRHSAEEEALLSVLEIMPNSLTNTLLTLRQSRKRISDQLSPPNCQDVPHAHALLERLGLSRYYPKGLQVQDALCIREEPLKLSLGKITSTDPQKLPHLILHKLMACDLLCRSDLMPVVEENDAFETETLLSDSESKDDSDDSFVDISLKGVHPVDCLLAIIFCSSDFLCQDLLSRLAKCQLAVPFILPDPFTKQLAIPLWGLCSIIKEWECINEKDEIEKKIQAMISNKMPIVTFIRLGEHQDNIKSKSAILNEVISDSHYDHFFHRDCKGGDYKQVLGDGLVDMCWYLPGKAHTIFPDAITFLNLHGDAREHPEQMRFLSQISSMCFVLLTEEGLELDGVTAESLEQFGSSAGGITVLISSKNIPKSLKKTSVINIKTNIARIAKNIQNQLKKKLDWSSTFRSVEDYCCTLHINAPLILIDQPCKECFEHASKIRTLVTAHYSFPKDKRKSGVRDSLLPLQGENLWKAWADYDKEIQRQIRRGSKSVNDYTEDIRLQKVAIRKQQLEQLNSLTPVIQSFTVFLLRLGGPSNRVARNYFLQCLKHELNNLSRAWISDMEHQYLSTRKELSLSQDRKVLKRGLEGLQEDINNSSFGLEYLLRELSQVYEAALESQLYGDKLSRLPKAAAELLIDGYPLELVDGDAAHMPLQWVTAVLEETTKMLDDPNMFVLSVLGLQSTGKSTLLNTVFGLQFNVSAGRCTRGAFMQLLPLDDELKTQTSCSYLLIVDTEGLRAPQRDSPNARKHDNELATFVIGLANMTLINIYGEVPGDMDDILQTSVHAFLRMTQLKFNPSCQFVHQNAGASVSSEIGRAKFTEKLNQFTIEAAKQEKCDGKFKCFNDVIKFNDQSDVHYFPGLWKGDPPMAPVNQGYSQSAQNLKLHLIMAIRKRAVNPCKVDNLHLSFFTKKVQDLWEALLRENFVFSFKNTQEISAYNSLETEYSKWDWDFRKGILEWERTAENEISAEGAGTAFVLAEQKCQELKKFISTLSHSIKPKMISFFSGRQSEILAQWKAKFERRFENLVEELRLRAERHCLKLGKSRETISKLEQDRKDYTARITKQVQDCVASLRTEYKQISKSLEEGKVNSDQLEIILKRELFTHERLKNYEVQELVREDQVQRVQAIIDKSGGQLTQADLQDILLGKIFRLEQIKQILMMGKQTEEELDAEFSQVWQDIIQQVLPPVPFETSSVEREVERMLIQFFRVQGHESQIITKLQQSKKGLREWGTPLYYKRKTVKMIQLQRQRSVSLSSYLRRSITEKSRITAQKLIVEVLNEADNYLTRLAEQATDFKPEFVQKLLRDADSFITKKIEAIAVRDHPTFTLEHRHIMFLIVCGHAIPKFEEMATLFRERTDPHDYLEKHVRKPLLTKFKNQYNSQTDGEKNIASTLCVLLEAPIKDQIETTVGFILADEMKGSENHFSSKMALKVKVLNDLHSENKFDYYMDYINDAKECIQSWLEHYTIQYADEKVFKSGETKLQMLAKREVSRIITVVKQGVAEVTETGIQEWLSAFSKHSTIVSELGNLKFDNVLTDYESIQEVHLDIFQLEIQKGLQELEKNLHASYASIGCKEHMAQWKNKPHELLTNLIGCTEQCPYCGEQCDLVDPDHINDSISQHRTSVHRPICLVGWRGRDSKLMKSDFCNSVVATEMCVYDKVNQRRYSFSEYTLVHPEWHIPPDRSSESSLYWKWFLGKYSRELADVYEAEPADIPEGWKHIEWSKVLKSLKSFL